MVCAQNDWKPMTLLPEAIEALTNYSWPGNVRELRNVVERVMLLALEGNVDRATVEMALPRLKSTSSADPLTASSGPLSDRVDSFERQTILSELKHHAYNMTATAKELGLERSHLYKKCQQLGIDLASLKAASD
jgi:DNA-binding NtrC family response regulator